MMRSVLIISLLGLAGIAGTFAQPPSGPGGPGGPGGSGGFPKVRWCVPIGAKPHCDSILPLVEVNVTLAGIFIGTFDDIIECVEYSNCDEPDGPLATGLAEVGSDIDGGKLFELFQVAPLITLLASEDEGDVVGEPADIRGYYGTPVVRRGSELCNASTVEEALSGARTCHTGYQRTAGWKIPVGSLIECEILPEVCDFCEGNHALASVASFVGSACVPGAIDFPPFNETMCANCIGEGEDFCTGNDPYAGYGGAFRCLVEDSGDVAFVRQRTVPTFSGANTPDWSDEEIDPNDFVLLCKEGGCAEIEDFETCSWAQTIFHTTILVFQFPQPEMIEILRAGFDAASALPEIQEFFTGGPKQGILFDPGTTKLVRIDDDIEDYAAALFAAFDGLEDVDNGINCQKYKWCVEPSAVSACEEMLMVANLTDLIECFGSTECYETDGPLVTGEAQLASNVDGGPYYELFKTANIQPLASEDEGDALGQPADIRGYYAIAVVDAGSPLCSAANIGEAIEGKRTCHTGYQKTAGWKIPVGTLYECGFVHPLIDNSLPNDLSTFEAFVDSACVPGAVPLNEYDDSLCLNCIGMGADFCDRNTDPYADYEGAFRCLVDGAGDVAFIKETTIPDFSGPNTPPEWNINGQLNASDYQILCKEGGCVSLDDFEQCALAQTVFHSTVVRPCVPQEDVMMIQEKLEAASMKPEFAKFLKGGSEAGIIFEDGATKLVPVTVDGATYGGALFDAFEGLDELNEIVCDCGDLNLDGQITVQDIVLLVSSILGTEAEIKCTLDVANLNGDNVVDVLDVIILQNNILSGAPITC